MEDFEAIVSPFVMAARRKALENKLSTLELTAAEQADLVRFNASPEYETLLKLMEGEIIKSETEHFRQWKDERLFLHTGYVAVAQRIFFERIQMEIKRRVEEIHGEIERQRLESEVARMTPEQLLENSI